MEYEQAQRGLFAVLTQEMRNYSSKTIKAYKSCVRNFAQHIAPNGLKCPDDQDIHTCFEKTNRENTQST